MLEAPIRNRRRTPCLTIAFLAIVSGAFCSCATEKAHTTALVGDPDAQTETSIPWNKPAKWESGANLPGGIGTSAAAQAANPDY